MSNTDFDNETEAKFTNRDKIEQELDPELGSTLRVGMYDMMRNHFGVEYADRWLANTAEEPQESADWHINPFHGGLESGPPPSGFDKNGRPLPGYDRQGRPLEPEAQEAQAADPGKGASHTGKGEVEPTPEGELSDSSTQMVSKELSDSSTQMVSNVSDGFTVRELARTREFNLAALRLLLPQFPDYPGGSEGWVLADHQARRTLDAGRSGKLTCPIHDHGEPSARIVIREDGLAELLDFGNENKHSAFSLPYVYFATLADPGLRLPSLTGISWVMWALRIAVEGSVIPPAPIPEPDTSGLSANAAAALRGYHLLLQIWWDRDWGMEVIYASKFAAVWARLGSKTTAYRAINELVKAGYLVPSQNRGKALFLPGWFDYDNINREE